MGIELSEMQRVAEYQLGWNDAQVQRVRAEDKSLVYFIGYADALARAAYRADSFRDQPRDNVVMFQQYVN